MQLIRIRLTWINSDGASAQLVGWWPSITAAARTAAARGASQLRAQVLSSPYWAAPAR